MKKQKRDRPKQRVRDSSNLTLWAMIPGWALLFALGLWPVIPVAQYRSVPRTQEVEELGTSREQLLPAGIVVRHLSVLQYLLKRNSIERSQHDCTHDCQIRVRKPLQLDYERKAGASSGIWAAITRWITPQPPTYPMKLTLPKNQQLATELMDERTTLSTLATVQVSVPGYARFEIVRNDAAAPLASASTHTWSGRLTDGSGDAVVTVDKDNGSISLVIYRFNETITVLPSTNTGPTYDIDVIPAQPDAHASTRSLSNAGVSSSTAFSDMCDTPADRASDDWIAAALVTQALAEAPVVPTDWCNLTNTSVPIAGVTQWPRLIQRYRTTLGEDCGVCIARLHTFYSARSAPPVIKVLPVVSSLLLDATGNNPKISTALSTAQQNINDALKRSRIPGRFEILQPFERIELGPNSEAEKAVLKSGLPELYKLIRTSGPQIDLAHAWRPYAELQRLRARHEANVVALITLNGPEGGADGLTARIPASDDLFFTVVQAGRHFQQSAHWVEDAATDNLAGGHTLAHELGHLVGAMHQLQLAGQRVPPSSHGFEFSLDYEGRPVTIGTLESQVDRRLLAFSNRCGVCANRRLGQAWFADSAATVAAQMIKVATLRGQTRESAPSQPTVCQTYRREVAVTQRELPPFEDCSTEPMIFRFDALKPALTDPTRLVTCAIHLVERIEQRDKEIMDDLALRGTVRPVAIVAGYADAQGSESGNIGLSWQRAEHGAQIIRQALLQSENHRQYDIPLYVCYYGETRPLCDEDKAIPSQREACRHANRRIELSVIGIPNL